VVQVLAQVQAQEAAQEPPQDLENQHLAQVLERAVKRAQEALQALERVLAQQLVLEPQPVLVRVLDRLATQAQVLFQKQQPRHPLDLGLVVLCTGAATQGSCPRCSPPT
jgi:hypothetical protein